MDIVISLECQKIYNQVFLLLLQIKWAKYSLDVLLFGGKICFQQINYNLILALKKKGWWSLVISAVYTSVKMTCIHSNGFTDVNEMPGSCMSSLSEIQ